MRYFIEYWILALKLTKAQALALFYRFVRLAAGTEEDEAEDPPKWYDFPTASSCCGPAICKDPDCPVTKEQARMDAARKKDEEEEKDE